MSTAATEILDKLRKRLLDLSRRNTLLNYKKTTRALEIVDELPDMIWKILVEDGTPMELLSREDRSTSSDESEESGGAGETLHVSTTQKRERSFSSQPELPHHSAGIDEHHVDTCLQTSCPDESFEARCNKLLNESKLAIEETGSNILYLALGFLEWYESDASETVNTAPLILIPIRVERVRNARRDGRYSYYISYNGEDMETNLSLASKLDNDFQLVLPALDEDQKKPEEYFNKVSAVVAKKKRWRIARKAVLGFFNFAKLMMYRDLDVTTWPANKQIEHQAILRAILLGEKLQNPAGGGGGPDTGFDADKAAENFHLVLDADSSQLEAVGEVVEKGRNLVIDGPPGTGKSQTISNLIAAALTRRKTVLFVAEKKAALEVVRSRLDRLGLGDFCLELHSHKTQKGQLHADLKKRMQKKYDIVPNVHRLRAELQAQKDQLRSYADLLCQRVGPDGETVHELFWKVEKFRSQLKAGLPGFLIETPLAYTQEQINARGHKLAGLAGQRAELTDEVVAAWSAFPSGTILPGDEVRITELFRSLERESRKLAEFLAPLPLPQTVTALRQWAEFDTRLLSTVPPSFQPTVAANCISEENRNILLTLSKDIAELRKQCSIAQLVWKCSIQTKEKLAALKAAVGELLAHQLNGETPAGLRNILRTTESVVQGLGELQAIGKTFGPLFPEPLVTLKACDTIPGLSQVLRKMPKDFPAHRHPQYALAAAPAALAKARSEGASIKGRLDALGRTFDLARTGSGGDVAALCAELRSYESVSFRFLYAGYRRARAAAKKLLLEGKRLRLGKLIEELADLERVLRDADAFRNNKSSAAMFGPLFTGLTTNWLRLETFINWGQSLRSVAVSESAAGDFIQGYDAHADRIRSAAERAEGLPLRIRNGLEKIGIAFDEGQHLTDIAQKAEGLLKLQKPLEVLSAYSALMDRQIQEVDASIRGHYAAHAVRDRIRSTPAYREVCGASYKEENTDVASLLSVAQWVGDLSAKCDRQVLVWLLDDAFSSKAKLLVGAAEMIRAYGTEYDRTTGELTAALRLNRNLFDPGVEQPATVRDAAARCLEQMHGLGLWSSYCRTLREAEELGLRPVTDLGAGGSLRPAEYEPYYYYSLYNSMVRALVLQHEVLAAFSGTAHETIRARFQQADREMIHLTSAHIASLIADREVPAGNSAGPIKSFTERGLLEHEVGKVKKHRPIRHLLQFAGQALQALKPCFMMSPLSVAQYVKLGDMEFDLCIMDEASQIRPEDALGAIMRSKQVVVVGDKCQLPPTTFFDAIDRSQADEDKMVAIEEKESILESCERCFGRKRLVWHYRSEHEGLIAFSNSRFYDNELVVFPGNRRQDAHGVVHHYIEGARYSKQRNMKEAERVVAGIAEHFTHRPHLSLGVVTVNSEQRDLVDDLLEKHLRQDPLLQQQILDAEGGSEPFFIKNLENVQGDERDAIIVSTTFGPDLETGRVSQNFGPISQETGWRRLNVLFTRAKKRLDLFTSLRPGEIVPDQQAKDGVRAFKAYIEYASTGKLVDSGTTGTRGPDSDFEVCVANMLRQHGYEAHPQIGVARYFIDIGVRLPGMAEYILGVECDGASYHSAKSVRDRDRLRQEILEQKGWTIHRIWSTDWYKNREIEIKKLLSRLEALSHKQH